MEPTEQELMAAARSLPEQIAVPMRIALERSQFRIGAWAYETDLAVCPLVAAARTAGVWHDGWPMFGEPGWGTEQGPSTEMEEFAASFDLCAEECGLETAIATVVAAWTELTSGEAERALMQG